MSRDELLKDIFERLDIIRRIVTTRGLKSRGEGMMRIIKMVTLHIHHTKIFIKGCTK